MRARIWLSVATVIAAGALLGACGEAFTTAPADAGGGGSGGGEGGNGGSGGSGAQCGGNEVLCGGVCVGRDDPQFGCGNPNCQPCNTTFAKAECSGDGCTITECSPGHGNCDQDPKNGCETPLNSAKDCGGCGTTCPASQVCSNGNCADSCLSGAEVCNGSCANTATDPSNCGSCGNQCTAPANATPGCAGGHCKWTCNTDYGDCDSNPDNGCETALNTAQHCGDCNIGCGAQPNAAASCTSGSCNIVCLSGFGNCDSNLGNGCEADFGNDVANCGACGTTCTSGSSPACCSGNCKNLASDALNCGDCGTVCAGQNASGSCSNGACKLQCASGFQDCDNQCSNGCECAVGSCLDAAVTCTLQVSCSG
jgi:Stigma-specific protein, Stig1